MSKPRVLIVDGHLRHMLSVVRSIGDEYDVTVASPGRFSICSASRYCKKHFVLPGNASADEEIVSLCRNQSFDYVVCALEATLIGLSRRYQELLSLGVQPLFTEFATLDKALDKSRTLEFATRCKVPMPRSVTVNSNDEIAAAANEIGFPVVIKPRRSISIRGDETWTNRGPMYASNEKQLSNLVSNLPEHLEPPIVQEYIPGDCVGGFFLIDEQGVCLCEFAHERIRDVNPTGSGSTFRKSVPVDPEGRRYSLDLLKAMNWRGVAMVEFRRSSEDGKLYLMEVNGRLWGSLDLAFRSGVNFPKLMLQAKNKENSSVGPDIQSQRIPYQEEVHLRWLLGDVLRFLRIMRGRPKGFPGKYPGRWEGIKELVDPRNLVCKYEVLRFTDPMPFVAEIASVFRRSART